MKTSNKVAFATMLSLVLSACGGGGGGGNDGGNGANNGGGAGQTFVVSGTVSGTNDTPVALSNAGANKTNAETNRRFSFDVSNGTSYNIVVESNPLEFLCQIENATGNNIQADVDNVEVICQPVASAPSCSGLADSDEDGLSDCDELERYFTNPWLADTDGDSFSDAQEVADFDPNNNPYIFNPRVADMATIAVDLTAVPEIDLDFTESTGSSRNVSTTYEQSESNSISRDWGGETSRQLEVGHTFSVSNTQTVGAEISVSPTDLGGSVSYENSLTIGFESSTSQTRGSSVNWSKSASEENSQAYAETVSLTEDEGSTYSGGFLRVTARVRNDGHIPYDLENLTLSAVLFDPKRPFDIESVGTMEFSDGGFPLTSILSGESAPLNFSTNLTLGKAQQLLRDSENIVIMPGTYRLLDIDDRSLLLVDRDVSARTAEIVIDYGVDAAREDKHRVSVNRGDGSRFISLEAALEDVLDLNVETGTGYWTYGNEAQASETAPGLLRIGNYAMDSSNDSNRYWLIAHNRNGDGERVTDFYNLLQDGYDLSQIQLRADDKVSLVYVGDADRDGISDRYERELGTMPEEFDTDTDELGDGLEVYGWLTNFGNAPCDQGDELTRVYSNPLLIDSDEDGNTDAQERENCQNPSFNFVAEAGAEQIVNKRAAVTLSAESVKSSGDSSPVYTWNLISGPQVEGANGATVSQLNGRRPSFTAPDEVSSLVWELSILLDGEVQTDTVVVQVQENRMEAIYVGTANPNANADGTREAPYPSLSEALQSLREGEDLYVMTQNEPYSLVNSLDIPDGTSLYGGYDENWIRDTESQPTRVVRDTGTNSNAITINAITQDMWFSGFSVFANGDNDSATTANNVVALSVEGDANSNTGTLFLDRNTFEASAVKSGTSTTPGSSYAVKIQGLSSLKLFENTLIAGAGGRAANGSEGSPGVRGNNASGITSGKGHAGGNGGNGGSGGGAPLGNGSGGADGGPSSSGGDGGSGGSGTFCSSDNARSAQVGDPGGNGAPGADGAAAPSPMYDMLALEYVPFPASDGALGEHGRGGGGGGGGKACDVGAGGGRGGGGGEGGTRGTPGSAGYSGGASIGLWLDQVTSSEIRGNTISASSGGIAGSGGRGGSGGAGGSYASGASGSENFLGTRGQSGARGGNGGAGGRGGHGGGGTGGPSFGIFVGPDLAPLLFNNSIAASTGGSGGFSYGNAGNGGDAFAVFDADTGDGASPELGSSNSLVAGTAGARGSNGTGGTPGTIGNAGETNF